MGRRQGLTAAAAAAVALSLVAPSAAAARPRPARRAPAPAGPVERLRRDVVAHLARSGAGVRAAAVALEGFGTVVAVRAGELLPPASTQKLYTAGAALLALGPDRRLRTEVRVTRDTPPAPADPPLLPLPLPAGGGGPTPPAVDPSVVRDLALVAGGDPSLSGARLDALAADVAAAGVRRVAGTLWVDDTRHDRARAARGWKPRFVPDESGPLSALAVDVNGWRSDDAFLADPATSNGRRFRDALARHGVAVDGPTSLGPLPGGPGETVAVSESAPVADLVRHLLAASDNFQSEVLLKEVGAAGGAGGSTAGGVAVLERLQDAMAAPKGQSADGSGLSSLGRQTADGEVRWLMGVDTGPAGPAFAAALPRYCSGPGTLRNRLCGTPAAGRMAAKTGSLPGVVTLAGTGTTGSGRRVWFAFLLSGVRSAPNARAAVDRAVLSLATSGA